MTNTTLTDLANVSSNLTYVFLSLGSVMVSCHSQARVATGSSDVAFESLQLHILGKV